MPMQKSLHLVRGVVEFPYGLLPGDSRSGNQLSLARDGTGRPVLRGTSIAGALRHATLDLLDIENPDDGASRWFGSSAGEEGRPSVIKVRDMTIDCGKSGVESRTHNSLDRHRRAALDGGLFEIEAIPPGATGTFELVLEEECEQGGAGSGERFLAGLVGLLQEGMTFGGNASRGIGWTRLKGVSGVRTFKLNQLEELAAWLDLERQLRESPRLDVPAGSPESRPSTVYSSANRLVINLGLGIPRGQDLLIGGTRDSKGPTPQRVLCADGKVRWRIPGASLRGVFRQWMTRLAARSGHPVADSLARNQLRRGESPSGNDLATGFATEVEQREWRANPALIPCPMMRLFGSAFNKGRILFTDALSNVEASERSSQKRMHVAVDRFYGGARNQGLFENDVLVHSSDLEFSSNLVLNHPGQDEVEWLAGALRGLHMGLVRLGSGKASGRVEVRSLAAKGAMSELFENLFQVRSDRR